ncbi:MAG: transcription elongation factor GreA [Firmicutes bacterium]|nr:transcription elongation factor GreA [Bacillota bacterium]
MEQNVLTYEGLRKLEAELEDLKTTKRKEVAQKIKEARAQGDLSENAEYDAAKDQQGEIESRIAEIEKLLRNVVVIDDEDIQEGQVSLGSKVLLLDMEFDEELEYTIVGSTEADPMNGLISNESPVGSALLGSTEGSVVEVETPGGTQSFKILKISR